MSLSIVVLAGVVTGVYFALRRKSSLINTLMDDSVIKSEADSASMRNEALIIFYGTMGGIIIFNKVFMPVPVSYTHLTLRTICSV